MNERSDSKQKDSAPLVSIQYIGNTKGQERSLEGSWVWEGGVVFFPKYFSNHIFAYFFPNIQTSN